MEWSKLFANLPDDPRIQAAEDDGGAGWLLVQSFCYVTRAESLVDGEGFIPDTQVRRFGCTPKQVTALVRERLYIRDDLRKGYLLDPDIWNEDRNLSDSAERKRKADRERMAAKRAAVRSELNGHLSRDSRTTHSATRGQDRPAVSRDNRALDLDLDQRRSDLSLVEGRDQPSRRNAPDQPVQLPLVAVAKLADRFAHVLDDDDLLKAVIGLINAGTGRVISAGQARGIAADILGAAKRQVSDPAAYVRKAISGEQDPAARWLDSSDTEHVAPLRPTWCGECDERTRQREKPDGTPYYCPNCNERATAS